MLGKENEAYLWFDATSFTKAGVLSSFSSSSPIIPPCLFIEEIEKCVEDALRWLLGLMDIRGEIRRLNYRVGHEAKNVRMVVIASANNVKLLKTLLAGALYSRFQSKIYCPPPDRPSMEQILHAGR
jgi:SpoVK/Ycf46/Vps4 family AAA+-type ATPase